MSNGMDLTALMNATKTTETTDKKQRPIGRIAIEFQGISIFTKDVWAESKAKDKVNNDINDLAINNPEQVEEIISKLITSGALEVKLHMTREGDSSTTLEDIFKSISK